MNVGTRELRTRLKYYLDRLEAGEEIVIIINSAIIGRMVPQHPASPEGSVALGDDRQVLFRGFKPADREAVIGLHELTRRPEARAFGEGAEPGVLDDLDLEDIERAYLGLKGDFVVGELDGEVVAELKRMRVRPDLWGQGIGSALLRLLEERATAQGYTAVILDAVAGTPAEKFYERHGYREVRRKRDSGFQLVFYKKEL